VFLILPTADTECFQIFLYTLAKRYSRSHILLFVDGAGNHNSGGLVIPSNVTLSPLPAYSPELNPQENIWDEIREKIFKNYASNRWMQCMTSSSRQQSTSSVIENS
jgi:transposase